MNKQLLKVLKELYEETYLKVITVLIITTFFLHAQVIFSQFIKVNVHGKVTDEKSAGIFGASVVFISLNNADTTIAITDEEGFYSKDINLIETGIYDETSTQTQYFELSQNYPNPFNPSTVIEFEIPVTVHVNLAVFNILGQFICELVNQEYSAGRFSVQWDGTDYNGMHVGAGVYFYCLKAGRFVKTNKMLLLDSGNSGGNGRVMTEKPVSHQKPAYFDVLFRIRVQKEGYLLNGLENFVISSVDSNIEKDFTMRTLDIKRALCYYQSVDGWCYALSSLDGSSPKIIRSSNETPKPAWSPDGRYFAHIQYQQLHVMDLGTGYIDNFGVTKAYGGNNGLEWTPDSKKIIFYRFAGGSTYIPFIINRNGSDVQEMPDFFNKKRFYLKDNYHFVYVDSSKVYKSDLDGSSPGELLDLSECFESGTYINTKSYGFNPLTNNLLLTINNCVLLTINIETSNINTLSVADEKWVYLRPVYSPDFSKVAFIERNYDDHISKIVIFENGKKEDLVVLTGKSEWIDYHPMTFSPNGQYLAYTKNMNCEGSFVWWTSYLYIVDIDTKETIFIDTGIMPLWNPLFPY